MQIFRKRFLYNSQKPVFQNANVKTFQCMNTETKDQRLLLLQHLKQPPFVDPSPEILQPIQAPTMAEPFSVYPLADCCSNIKKINEIDAMYILKCLTQSKVKNPLYYLISPQGVCVSQVQGLLPERSPSLFEIAINMLDIPANLTEVQKSVVSKDGYEICKALKDGYNPANLFNKYGWKDAKKDKSNNITENEYWIFKGRRKQQSPFGDQYGLAWHPQYNLCRFKYIDLSKDGYQDDFYNDFKKKIDQFQKADQQKLDLLQIYKYEKDLKGLKIFSQIPNQGSLSEYIITKFNQGKTLTEKTALSLLQAFVMGMKKLKEKSSIKGISTLHLKNIFVHNNRLVIGQPLLITDKVQKKIRQLKNGVDYFSPQLKQNILFAENLLKLDSQKMDIWFFGLMLYKIFVRQVPIFDSTRKPIFPKDKFSPGMQDLILRCLSLTPANRPSWADINLKDLQKTVIVQEVQQEPKGQKQQITLGTKKQRPVSRQSLLKNKIDHDFIVQSKKAKEDIVVADQNFKLKDEEPVQEKQLMIVTQTNPKFRRFKLILKTILVLALYIFVFFRSFLSRSIDMLLVRGYYVTASIHLISQSGTRLSTATILTNDPDYFMINDITFDTLNSQLHCIDNKFNPMFDPNYQINTFIQSGSFLGMLLLGWIIAIIICVTKIVSIWKGGIGNKTNKTQKQQKYWLVYGFHQLSLAALLFAHFYLFQFFYFSVSQPCFGIENFSGIEPFFDSSLYIFLGNTQKFMSQIFACLGILGMIILFSTCFYAWGPKLDQKNFFSVFSIILRMVPYVLFILFCRVGIFVIMTPSAINDENGILSYLVSESFTGLLGVIPEIFIAGCILFEIGYEYFINWVEKKIMDSVKWSRFFNLRKGKGTQNMSKISKLQESKLNDMSFNNSKHQLVLEEY